jgi:hypothetical protein
VSLVCFLFLNYLMFIYLIILLRLISRINILIDLIITRDNI